MALKTVRIGAVPDAFQYDDAVYPSAIEATDPIKAGVPVDPSDVLRLVDIGGTVGNVVGPAGAVSSNLVEFDGITGKKLKDGGLSHADVADAITEKHTRSHAISSTSDHSDINLAGISNKDLMQWDDPSSKWLPKSVAEIISGQNIAPGTVTIGTVEDWCYAASIADDGTKALPTIKADYAAKVEVIVSAAGIIEANAAFMIDSTGTVTPQIESAGNIVYNVDTDVKLCIGTAAAQNPLTIKNRLGGVKNIMITMKYVKA
jgi:hypothetical protein